MLTKTLIKPFLEDLEGDGVEDTTTYEYGFRAGMAALADILSQNIDKQPQFFVYLGMAISEGAQWVESLAMKENDIAPIFEKEEGFGVKVTFPDGYFESLFDFIPTIDTPAALIKKYIGANVLYKTLENMGEVKPGRMVLGLAGDLILIDKQTDEQIKKPYYVQL
jgi:hypothetical protein